MTYRGPDHHAGTRRVHVHGQPLPAGNRPDDSGRREHAQAPPAGRPWCNLAVTMNQPAPAQPGFPASDALLEPGSHQSLIDQSGARNPPVQVQAVHVRQRARWHEASGIIESTQCRRKPRQRPVGAGPPRMGVDLTDGTQCRHSDGGRPLRRLLCAPQQSIAQRRGGVARASPQRPQDGRQRDRTPRTPDRRQLRLACESVGSGHAPEASQRSRTAVTP
jgi:hypothetical protein